MGGRGGNQSQRISRSVRWGPDGECVHGVDGGMEKREPQELSMTGNWLLGREPEVTGIASLEQFDNCH